MTRISDEGLQKIIELPEDAPHYMQLPAMICEHIAKELLLARRVIEAARYVSGVYDKGTNSISDREIMLCDSLQAYDDYVNDAERKK